MKPDGTSLGSCLAYGAVAGMTLALSHFWPSASPLQIVAWGLVFVPMIRGCGALRASAMGGAMVLVFAVAVLSPVRLPAGVTIGLAGYLGVLYIGYAAMAAQLLRGARVRDGVAAAALLVVVEWVDVAVVPFFGTAQCFARPWSAVPAAIQFSAVTGILGVVFAVAMLAAMAALAVCVPAARRRATLAAVAFLAVIASIDVACWRAEPRERMTVGAVGFAGSIDESGLVSLVEGAARRGATLIAIPETSLDVGSDLERKELLARWRAHARRLGATLAIGFFDHPRHDNRVALLGPEASSADSPAIEYTKTHLVPGMERYRVGDGTIAPARVGGTVVAAMICQDDNFTDIQRACAAAGVGIVVVPTNDWRGVHELHLQNSRHRAIEARYAVVRAASNGISAIISSRGEILAARDHFREGAGAVVAEIEVAPWLTPFARWGHWIVAPCLGLVAWSAIMSWRRRSCDLA